MWRGRPRPRRGQSPELSGLTKELRLYYVGNTCLQSYQEWPSGQALQCRREQSNANHVSKGQTSRADIRYPLRVVSPLIVILLMFSDAQYLRIPVGLVAPPLLYLNINFDIQHPRHFLTGILLVLFAGTSYAATGWITGAAAVLSFNFIARRTGGIEASVLTKESLT